MSADVSADRRLVLRIRDAAPMLDMPESTLRSLCRSGKVDAEKVGRGWRVKIAYVQKVTAPAPDGAS